MLIKRLRVYSDGASGNKTGKAIGWGWLAVEEGLGVVGGGYGGHPSGTNNVAELTGAICGLEFAAKYMAEQPEVKWHVTLVSDSNYVLGMGSRKMSGLKNLELVDKLAGLCDVMVQEFEWVKGHSGEPYNEMCDKLAGKGKKEYLDRG